MKSCMKLGAIALAVCTVLSLPNVQAAPGETAHRVAAPAPGFRDGELLIKFRDGFGADQLDAEAAALGGDTVRRFRRPRQLSGSKMERWRHVRLRKGLSMEEAIARFSAHPAVEYVEPNYVWHASTTPNDPRFNELWGLNNTGQTGGTADADVDAPEAWDLATGDSTVVVGVVDSGVTDYHPDLAANMWVNTGEIPGNNIDDDGNGYIDDIHGYDFVNNDGDPLDDDSHGSHVSGTIGAVGNNGVGISGVAWNVRVMGLKFLSANGTGSTTDAIDAILYGVDMGADILNNSWGGGGFSTALQNAIQTADSAGVLFVAAAGNEGRNNDQFASYPANYDVPNIISVAATDHNDQLASFSNFGVTTVDLAAPGVAILSTVPYANEHSLTVDGTSYQGNGIEFATSGSASGPVADGGLCQAAGAWAGQVVLCERGVNTFLEKVMAVQNGGGVAAVIYNNAPGNFTGTLGAGNSSTIPAISLSQADGQLLVATALGQTGDVTSINDPNGFGYDLFDGTSMATPQVSGAAAVLLAAEPGLSALDLKTRILDTVDVIPGLANAVATSGRLNLHSALTSGGGGTNQPPVADAGTDQSVAPLAIVTLSGSGSSDADGTVVGYSWAHIAGGRRTLSIRNATREVTRVRMPRVRSTTDFVFELTVTDDDGATSTDTVTVTVTP